VPVIALLAYLCVRAWAGRDMTTLRLTRLARRRMVNRLPYPDPRWRRPLTRFRYRIGVAVLRPYLDRMFAFCRDQYDSTRSDYHLHKFFALDEIIRLRSDVGFGDAGMLRYQTAPGWPLHFHLFLPRRWWR